MVGLRTLKLSIATPRDQAGHETSRLIWIGELVLINIAAKKVAKLIAVRAISIASDY
jgi:hypothetical protein